MRLNLFELCWLMLFLKFILGGDESVMDKVMEL